MKKIYIFITGLFLSAGCSKLSTIPYCCPELSPEIWCFNNPCMNVNLGPLSFIWAKPTSTFFIYSLGILTIIIAIYFIKNRENSKSRLWWGIGLVLWGVSAIFAGTSYQAFSYEIKCAGKEVCSWTSWWEVWYLILQTFSMNSILYAVANSSTTGKLRKGITIFALANSLIYLATALTGSFIPVKFLVSFELMLLFTCPTFIIVSFINLLNYIKTKEKLEIKLFITWLFAGFVILIYFFYFSMGYTQILWKRGIWFSANDVLHIGLILWMLNLRFGVYKYIFDKG